MLHHTKQFFLIIKISIYSHNKTSHEEEEEAETNSWARYVLAKQVGLSSNSPHVENLCPQNFPECPLDPTEIMDAIKKPEDICYSTTGVPEINPEKFSKISEHILQNLVLKAQDKKEVDGAKSSTQ